jgi:hypothetical protein
MWRKFSKKTFIGVYGSNGGLGLRIFQWTCLKMGISGKQSKNGNQLWILIFWEIKDIGGKVSVFLNMCHFILQFGLNILNWKWENHCMKNKLVFMKLKCGHNNLLQCSLIWLIVVHKIVFQLTLRKKHCGNLKQK